MGDKMSHSNVASKVGKRVCEKGREIKRERGTGAYPSRSIHSPKNWQLAKSFFKKFQRQCKKWTTDTQRQNVDASYQSKKEPKREQKYKKNIEREKVEK